jgi:CheY-like chemotaxis protein
MEAIGRLAGGVAHDFNNLLSIIVCHVDLLLARDNTPPSLHEIRNAAARAGDLTRQLLAFSRRQVLSPRVVDPAVIVSSVTAMLARIVGSHIHVVVRTEAGGGRVKVDSTQLEQVVMNLVVNARDAMPGGGTLTVKMRSEDVGPHGAVPPGAYVVISVIDTGAGMDAATRARIFEPFFTTKPVGQGTGLGLATVLGIVEQSGGHVTVDSAPGRGTTFEVYLPRTEEAEAPVTSRSGPGSGTSATAATILLVEDEDSVRAVVRGILDRHGYEVIAASSAEDALSILEAQSPRVDLLLTDVVMPGRDGHELAERVRAMRPNARVLFMSGNAERHSEHPGAAFLQKPFSPGELAEKVRATLAAPRS